MPCAKVWELIGTRVVDHPLPASLACDTRGTISAAEFRADKCNTGGRNGEKDGVRQAQASELGGMTMGLRCRRLGKVGLL
jgi:hypothetical protein